MIELKVEQRSQKGRRPGAAHTRVRGVDRGATHTRGSRLTSNESAALPSYPADVQAVGTLSYDVFRGCWDG